ncbi:MAG: efflux RND transporter permease subunit [Rhizobiaceae bacterium]|nr:efflux RND transporter permease subunit [Rhizobiaceae bacterium]
MNSRHIPGSGGVISLFARHPNAANLVMVLMVLFGVFSLGWINTQFFPTIETNAVNVTIKWSGASAEDVSANILAIIEPEVRFVDGVEKMTSYAREGSGTVTLEFAADADMQKAVADVDSAVKAVSNLPQDSDAPKVSHRTFFDRVARLAISGDVPESTLRIYAKKIRDDLIERGIDKVEFSGMRDEELQITVPNRELRRLGLSIRDISNSISNNSRDTPSGQMDGQVEKQIRALADMDSPSTIGNIEVKSFSTGEKVLLRDIATVRRGYNDSQKQGFTGGKRAIQITVQRAPSADTLATAKILDDYLAVIDEALPPGIILTKYEVRADALVERIMLLVRNGMGGLVLVVGTLFIFLNTRIAFWVAMGIPVAMSATIGFMFVMGQSINMISLFGLIMMLGVIVDDAIVVGEHTATRFSAGDGPYEAAENGAGRMVTPVFAAMITTVAAFAPILLIGDIIGQIMGVLPMVVIAVIFSSLIECFLVLPGHLAHTLQPRVKRSWSFWRQLFFAFVAGAFVLSVTSRTSVGPVDVLDIGLLNQAAIAKANYPLPVFFSMLAVGSLIVGGIVEFLIFLLGKLRRSRRKELSIAGEFSDEGWFRRNFDRGFGKFRDGPFAKLVSLSFHYRYVTVAIALASVMVLAIGLIKGDHVKFVFFPSPESENIRSRLVFNAGIPEKRALEIIAEVEKSLHKTVEELTEGKEELVTAVFVTLGGAGRSVGDNLAEIRIQLTSSEIRTVRTSAIIKAWRGNLPKLAGSKRIAVYSPRGGPPGRDIDVEVLGEDVATLKKVAGELIGIVSAIPGINGVSDDLPFGKPELVMSLMPRGAALGFSIEEVGRQVRDAFDGAIPRRFARGDDEITVRVKRTTPDKGGAALRNFELRSPIGDFVPLTEVVSLTENQGFSAIQRKDGRAIVHITGDLDTDVMTTEEAIELLNASELPSIVSKYGLDYQFGGRAEERKKAFADLGLGVGMALMVIYIVLAWVFSSYWRPLAIMLIIPFGLVGAVFGHWILGYKLTILSFIGLLGLAGILVNDSIILVSRLDERLDEGEALDAAAIGASRDRLRAVLLTSLTTIGGLIPLMFEKSIQAQFLLPMAITIVFGLGLATLLVLFLVPALIGIGSDIRWLLDSVFGVRQKPPSTPGREVSTELAE